jgi:hypothetical protein
MYKTVLNITAGQTVGIPGPQGAMGVASLDVIGSAPNADGASLSGNVLNLQPCNATFGGVISDTTQDIPGEKNFKQTVNTEGNFNLPQTASNTVGCITVNDNVLLHNYPYHLASTYLGFECGNFGNNGGGNVAAAGFGALKNITDGTDNSALGTRSGENLTSSDRCTLLGYGAGRNITSGCDYSICIGNEAGLNLVNNSDNCIMIGNTGTLGNRKTIKIGQYGTHETCYLQGVTGTTGTDEMVCIEPSTGKLGKRALPGFSLGAIGATGDANGATLNGTVLNLQPATGSSGGVVTNGTQAFGGDKSFNGNVGCSGTISLSGTSSTTQGTVFAGADRFISRPGTRNTFIGEQSGNFTGTIDNNIGIGYRALQVAGTQASSGSNIAIGSNCLASWTRGNQNIGIGLNTLTGLTGGSGQNTCVGDTVAVNLLSGSGNVMMGKNTGNNYTSNESNNLLLANVGVAGETGNIRIGNSFHVACAIQGIHSKTSSSGIAVLVNSSGILGTTTSSLRYKENIETLDPEISSKLNDLRIVKFNYKDDPMKKTTYGLIAEECLKVYPDICVFDDDDESKPVNTVQYHILTPLLVAELQVQKRRIDQLEAQIQSLISH